MVTDGGRGRADGRWQTANGEWQSKDVTKLKLFYSFNKFEQSSTQKNVKCLNQGKLLRHTFVSEASIPERKAIWAIAMETTRLKRIWISSCFKFLYVRKKKIEKHF